MKKLMMVAAVALAAIGAQAAAIDWGFSEVVRSDKPYTDLSGATAYLFLASDWSTVAGKAKDGVIAADDFKGFLDSSSLTVTTGTSSSYNLTTYNMNQKSVKGQDAKVAGTQSYNVVLVEGEGGNISVSDAITKESWDDKATIPPTHTVALWNIGKAATSKFLSDGNAAFTYGAAPEPTSAMLILLGVAGMALRRRRA